MKLVSVRCPLCGAAGHEAAWTIGDWQIVRCARCRLAYLNPRPADDDLAALYDETYFVEDILHADGALRTALSEREIKQQIAANGEIVQIIERYTRPGSLLDVGCGLGFLLVAARERGWQVAGVDVAESACTFAREQFGLAVRQGRPEDLRPEDGTYDVVVMAHTLEHLPDPVGVCRHLRGIVRPGGLLVVDVPNYRGLDARLEGRRWEGWSVPYHLNHFEPATLRRVVVAAGFQPLGIETELSSYLVRGYVGLKRLARGWRSREVSLDDLGPVVYSSPRAMPGYRRQLRRLRRVLARLATGRDMTIIARRPAG